MFCVMNTRLATKIGKQIIKATKGKTTHVVNSIIDTFEKYSTLMLP